jgi:hypothetical protein
LSELIMHLSEGSTNGAHQMHLTGDQAKAGTHPMPKNSFAINMREYEHQVDGIGFC